SDTNDFADVFGNLLLVSKCRLKSVQWGGCLDGWHGDITELDAVSASEQVIRELLRVHAFFFCLRHKPVTHAGKGQDIHFVAQLGVDHCSLVLIGDLVINCGNELLIHDFPLPSYFYVILFEMRVLQLLTACTENRSPSVPTAQLLSAAFAYNIRGLAQPVPRR